MLGAKTKVYIPNKAPHDFSSAEAFGELVFITEGLLPNRYAITTMYRVIVHALRESKPDDWIVLCSLSSLCAILCSVFAVKHRRLNLLIHYNDTYKPKQLIFDSVEDVECSMSSLEQEE